MSREEDLCPTILPDGTYLCLHADTLLTRLQRARDSGDVSPLANVQRREDLLPLVNVFRCKTRLKFGVDMAWNRVFEAPQFDLPGDKLHFARFSGVSQYAVHAAKVYLASDEVVTQLDAWLAEIAALRDAPRTPGAHDQPAGDTP